MGTNNFKSENLSMAMDSSIKYITNLHNLGGFSYVLFGSGSLTIILDFFPKVASNNSCLPCYGIALVSLGTLTFIIQKIIAYKLAKDKMKVILSLIEKIIDNVLKEKGKDTAVADALMKNVIKSVWGFNIKEDKRENN